MRYHLTTLGCPKNTTDSERLVRALRAAGHAATDTARDADVLIVNSCGFIDAAKQESGDVTAALASDKAAGQQLLVVGCWSQIESQRIRAEHPNVDATFGIEAWDDIVRHLGPGDPADIPETGAPLQRASAYLKISDGCARPCTFCNIPGIKGVGDKTAIKLIKEFGTAEGVLEHVDDDHARSRGGDAQPLAGERLDRSLHHALHRAGVGLRLRP